MRNMSLKEASMINGLNVRKQEGKELWDNYSKNELSYPDILYAVADVAMLQHLTQYKIKTVDADWVINTRHISLSVSQEFVMTLEPSTQAVVENHRDKNWTWCQHEKCYD